MFDVIVVGCGPAGSTAAYTLARSGLKVLAIDKASFPRYKSCGGCISTKVERILDFSIQEAVDETVYGATFTYKSSRSVDVIAKTPVGHNVMRDVFDAFLVEKAKEAGARIIEGVRVKAVADKGGMVTVECEDGKEYSASVLVGADGAGGMVGRTLFGLNPRKAAVSITAEVPYDRERTDYKGKLFLDFGSVPFGYGWIFPKKKYLSVGLAGDAEKIGGRVKDYFKSFVNSHEALKGLKIDERVGWSVPIFYDGASTAVKGRVLLTGDAGHLVDPFLGEGIYYAMTTAKAAASVIIESIGKGGTPDLSKYQAWLESEIFPEFRAAEKLSDLVYNHPRLWYNIIEKEPDLMLRFYGVIRGEETTESFYSWVHGRIRSKPWKVIRRWIESRFMPL